MSAMELEWQQHRPARWQDHPHSPPSMSLAQRRRSSAANTRPAGPPPNLPIPSLPNSADIPDSRTRSRPSANLSAVAAFSQARQASSSSPPQNIHPSADDLSDPPPQSYLPPTSSRHHDRGQDTQSMLSPSMESPRAEHRPSSRRALTRALELAREAVQLDSTNDNPEAAVNAYAQSVALLSEVMERVRNGEESTDSHRRRRRRSVAAQEDEVRRLQNIHDTYADRMNILSIIYSIPAVPYPAASLYATAAVSNDSTTSNSPTTSASPSSDNSPQIPHQVYTPYIPEEEPLMHSDPNALYAQEHSDPTAHDAIYLLDESVLSGAAISGLPPSQHPYSVQYDAGSRPQPQVPPVRNSILARRHRAPSSLPPKSPPPAESLPPAPIAYEPSTEPPLNSRRPESQLRISESKGHKRSGSGLVALEEEGQDSDEGQTDTTLPIAAEGHTEKYIHEPLYTGTKRESHPLPPLPSPSLPSEIPQTRSLSFSKSPPSPRSVSIVAPRPRGSSQLTTRTELANVPHMNSTSQGTIIQRRKTSAPSSTRSASPAESTTSAGSAPYSKSVPSNSIITSGRLRSSSQPGRRPSLVGGRLSPEQLPPLPGSSANGTPRKVSVPSKLNPNQSSLQLDPIALQNGTFTSHASNFAANLPTTPTSPLPPAPPTDPLLKPYHMMNLLRNTMVATTGGYVTRRLHVPCEVWSQGGAKLTNLDEKIRVVTILCSALEDLQISSAESFGAGNVSSGLALGIGGIGRKEADAWLSKLEEFSNVCDHVVANFGKKLGVGEGFVSRKTTWGDKWTRRLDKFTNGKNLDSPAAYVQGLKKLFSYAQLLDEHTRAILSQPVAPSYAAFPMDIRGSAEQKLKRFSEFFASVVLTFVIRDLSQLLDKYVKKCEKWLAE